LEWKV